MKIKHWQGYGVLTATKVKDSATLHVRVEGNHEWGLVRDDEYDLFNWLVKKFDKSMKDKDYRDFHFMRPQIQIIPGYNNGVETCDYIFNYNK